ncbi:MAG: hypothetical protein AMXMBFR23_06120 [Chloroflexota bacterium]
MAAPYRDLAPDILRQRLLLEGTWTVEVDADTVRRCLLGLAGHLGLRTYGDPVVFAPASGMGREENAGWDAFVPLIDSGISGYFWAAPRFFSLVIYTCTRFDPDAAEAFVRDFLGVTGEVARLEF